MKLLIFSLLFASATAFTTGSAQALPLVVQGSERIASLNVYTLAGAETFAVTGHVIEPLARGEPFSERLEPWLARSWKFEKDGVTVSLRKNVKFHDGSDFTAQDVKFTFDSYFDPKFGGAMWQGMWKGIESPRIVDAHTLKFKMKEFSYETLERLLTSMRILSKKAYEKSEPKWRDANLIGTGPFKVKRFEPGRSLDLTPNEIYWGEKPAFDLRVKSIPDPKTAEMMIEKKELDFFPVSPAAASQIRSAHLKALDSGYGTGIMINLNLRNELFKEKRVREALWLLWSRAEINAKFFEDKWLLALDGFSPKMKFYPKGDPGGYDPAKAQSLLKEQGWKDQDKNGILEKGGQEFRFTLLVTSAEDERWASMFQQDAKKAGVHVDLKRIEEMSTVWKTLKEGKFDAVAQTGGLTPEVMAASWHSKADYGFYGFGDKEVDKKLDQLNKQSDPEKRAKIHKELIQIVRSHLPTLPGLYSSHVHYLISPKISVDPRFPAQAWRWKLAVSN